MPKKSDHDMNWRKLPEHDYFLFARSYHMTAKKLAGVLDLDPGPIPQFDLCPILSAYRHAIELHLKVIVLGDGGKFLTTRPDELSVHKTRSLSWLAQFVTLGSSFFAKTVDFGIMYRCRTCVIEQAPLVGTVHIIRPNTTQPQPKSHL